VKTKRSLARGPPAVQAFSFFVEAGWQKFQGAVRPYEMGCCRAWCPVGAEPRCPGGSDANITFALRAQRSRQLLATHSLTADPGPSERTTMKS
jgi:hypothetical protein